MGSSRPFDVGAVEPDDGFLVLCDGAGTPVACADLDMVLLAGMRPAPQAFSVLAGAPPGLVKFRAAARVLREVDGGVLGAILVLSDPSTAVTEG